jgi:hypothetical protein
MEKRKRPPLPIDASPQEKYDNLILTFYEEWMDLSRPAISINHILSQYNNDFSHLGFINPQELIEFLCGLIDENYLSSTALVGEVRFNRNSSLSITFKGRKYCHALLSSGKDSTRCFVAMKFSDDMVAFYENGIKKAIESTGFRSIRVDQEHAANEQTINDFIISSIKQSRFCVADLTHKSHGAYFEAGYALGRGLKVIYTCRRDHFENVHFDLKNMQIIQYDTPDELCEALRLKIQAFIID